MDANRREIGIRIREIRESLGMSQAELAGRTGYLQPNIARIEAGRYAIRFDTLTRIADALGCSVELVRRASSGSISASALTGCSLNGKEADVKMINDDTRLIDNKIGEFRNRKKMDKLQVMLGFKPGKQGRIHLIKSLWFGMSLFGATMNDDAPLWAWFIALANIAAAAYCCSKKNYKKYKFNVR